MSIRCIRRPDGRISGVVIEAQTRKPTAGFVTLEPSDPSKRRQLVRGVDCRGDDVENGTFSLEHLPPVRYRLVFGPKIGGGLRFDRLMATGVDRQR